MTYFFSGKIVPPVMQILFYHRNRNLAKKRKRPKPEFSGALKSRAAMQPVF
jgi:hypothetical protein